MKFLIVARQKKNVDSFRTTIARLLGQGHSVRLALQDRDAAQDARVVEGFAAPGFSLESAPTARSDDWRTYAPLVRRLRDWAQYLGPEYRNADKLRMRALDRLRGELGLDEAVLGDGLLPGLGASQAERVVALLARIEAAIPADPLHREFILRDTPDVVLVTPGLHFGSAQADVVKAARAAGIPVWMLLFSWDNLSTKGALHVLPDVMFVWNERQRAEAAALHRFPPERVVVVGAPRFDEFFELRQVVSRARFHAPLGLDPDARTLLYVCSSRFVSRHEISFVRRWLAAIRSSSDASLREANVVVRPHPDIPLLEDDNPEVITWPELPRAQGWVSRPFSDSRAVVLRTTHATLQPFFECLHHAAAVVGLNTSAELEAGIVGRPVFTVVSDDQVVTGQANTLHFHYLLKDNGGFVVSAPDLDTHVAQLAESLRTPPESDVRIRTFVQDFLRPRGSRPVSEVLAEELVAQAGRPHKETRAGTVGADLGRPAHAIANAEMSRPEKRVVFLRVGYPGSSIRIRATHETRKRRREGELLLDPDTVAWLDAHVMPSDVLYDIGAGLGEYSLIAATHRNALAYAFEPGFATFKRLCEHVILNDCRQTIVPLPIALGDRTGLLPLHYRKDAPGEDRHRLNPASWSRHPYEIDTSYTQPVCADRLDEVIARHNLPRPMHIRLHAPRNADAVVSGAADTLRDPGLKSVLVVAPRHEIRRAVEDVLGASGLALIKAERRIEPMLRLLFVRETARVRSRV